MQRCLQGTKPQHTNLVLWQRSHSQPAFYSVRWNQTGSVNKRWLILKHDNNSKVIQRRYFKQGHFILTLLAEYVPPRFARSMGFIVSFWRFSGFKIHYVQASTTLSMGLSSESDEVNEKKQKKPSKNSHCTSLKCASWVAVSPKPLCWVSKVRRRDKRRSAICRSFP